MQTWKWFFVYEKGKELLTSLFYMWAIIVLVTYTIYSIDHIVEAFLESGNLRVSIFSLIINRFSFLNIGFLQSASMTIFWIKLKTKKDEIMGEASVESLNRDSKMIKAT